LWLADLEKQPIGPNFDWIKLVDDFEAEYSMYALDYTGLTLNPHVNTVSETTEPSFIFILISRLLSTRSLPSTLTLSGVPQSRAQLISRTSARTSFPKTKKHNWRTC